MEKTYKDRKKLNLGVKKDFQRWLLLQVMVTVVLSSVVAALILYFYSRQELIGSFFDAHVKIRRVSDLLLPVIVAASTVSLVSGAFLALFLPQKIAGPLYRIEQGLKAVENGDLSVTIKLRENDILQDFAGRVNGAIGAMRNKVEEVTAAQKALEESICENSQVDILKSLEQQEDRLNGLPPEMCQEEAS